MFTRMFAAALALAAALSANVAPAADYPTPVEGDYVISDFHFASGEVLPELRIHYRTLGTAKLPQWGGSRTMGQLSVGPSQVASGFTVAVAPSKTLVALDGASSSRLLSSISRGS